MNFLIFPAWVNKLVIFDLRFGFLVKNYTYGQMLVKNDKNPVKLIHKMNIFGLCVITLVIEGVKRCY